MKSWQDDQPPGRAGWHPGPPPGPPFGKSSKFQKISAMRAESRASMLKYQVAQLDELSETLALPNTLRIYREIMTGPPHVNGATVTSFQERPYHERVIMHGAISVLNEEASNGPAAAAPMGKSSRSASELAAAVTALRSSCSVEDSSSERWIPSQFGGKFLCRPEQGSIVRRSTKT